MSVVNFCLLLRSIRWPEYTVVCLFMRWASSCVLRGAVRREDAVRVLVQVFLQAGVAVPPGGAERSGLVDSRVNVRGRPCADLHSA